MSYPIVTLLVVGGTAVACFLRVLAQAHLPKAIFFALVTVFCIGGLEVEGFSYVRVVPQGLRIMSVDIYQSTTMVYGFAERTIVTALADKHQGG